MARYSSYYYRLPNGRMPVKEFVDSLHISAYRKFIFKKELLEEFGPSLPMPHAKYFGDKLYELRFKGEGGAIRIFYFFVEERKIILVHAFIKKTRKIPVRDLSLAYKRMSDYFKR